MISKRELSTNDWVEAILGLCALGLAINGAFAGLLRGDATAIAIAGVVLALLVRR